MNAGAKLNSQNHKDNFHKPNATKVATEPKVIKQKGHPSSLYSQPWYVQRKYTKYDWPGFVSSHTLKSSMHSLALCLNRVEYSSMKCVLAHKK